MRLVTAEQMRRLDRATIDGGRASGEVLMERAGAGVVEAMERRYGPSLGLRVLVLCGTGNNGGDGLVAARHLDARGAEVHVGVLGDPARMSDDASLHLERLTAAGQRVTSIASVDELERFAALRDPWDYALDALLGTGARGEPEGLLAAGVEVLRRLDDAGVRVVALDLPTGVHADTGAIARRAVRADLTVTFGCPKRGHFLYPGRAFAGALEVVDIGLVDQGVDAGDVSVATPATMAALLPARDPRAHKSSVGRVLVIGGSMGLTGAVALAARAALRSGAGYVKAAIPSSLNDVLEVKLTEEMTVPMPETPERTLALAALEPLHAQAAEADVVVLGSGLSRHREAAELARRVVGESERALVIDADGLSAFEGHTEALARAAAPRVLTPHLGEMRRLTGIDATQLEATRIDAAREWAQRWNAVVLLKGAPTVVAAPDGRTSVNPTGNPGMATAGMGDVLAGVVAALMAQGLLPWDAARLGAYAHGMAGDLVAGEKGQYGLVAGDVIESMPLALVTLARLRAQSAEAPTTARPGQVRVPASFR
ncbi:MAG TPA: NAD(P)H-hydrate dehydratase [Candidatus Eisenbacteria bacterium]|nr:NAD(P)H-hydrate dehydratase [Candidatus Eisenbacteria bacterium]